MEHVLVSNWISDSIFCFTGRQAPLKFKHPHCTITLSQLQGGIESNTTDDWEDTMVRVSYGVLEFFVRKFDMMEESTEYMPDEPPEGRTVMF